MPSTALPKLGLALALGLAGAVAGVDASAHAHSIQDDRAAETPEERLVTIREAARSESKRVARRALSEFIGDELEAALVGLDADQQIALLGQVDVLAGEIGHLRARLRAREGLYDVVSDTRPLDDEFRIQVISGLAVACASVRDDERALALFEEAHDAVSSSETASVRLLLSTKQNLAAILAETGDLERSASMYEELIGAVEELRPEDDDVLLAVRQNLAYVLRSTGQLDEAVAIEIEIHETLSATRPPDDADVLVAKQNLGDAMLQLGRLDEAEALFFDVLAAREANCAPDDPLLIAARSNFACVLYERGAFEECHDIRVAIFESVEGRLRPSHSDVLDARINLAVVKVDLGALDQAREILLEVIALCDEHRRASDPRRWQARMNLATVYRRTGHLEAATSIHEEVVTLLSEALEQDHPSVLRALSNYAGCLAESGHITRALEIEEHVHRELARTLQKGDPDLLTARQNLAGRRLDFGDVEGAYELYTSVYDALVQTLDPDHERVLSVLSGIGVALMESGRCDEARPIFERLVHVRSERSPESIVRIARANNSLAAAEHRCGDRAYAADRARSALESLEGRVDPDHPTLLSLRVTLATIAFETGDFVAARELDASILEARSRALPAHHPRIIESTLAIAHDYRGLGDVETSRRWMKRAARAIGDRAERALLASSRPSAAEAVRALEWLSDTRIASVGTEVDEELDRLFFEARETIRSSATSPLAFTDAETDAATRDRFLEMRRKERQLESLIVSPPSADGSVDGGRSSDEMRRWRRAIGELALEVERIEKECLEDAARARPHGGRVDLDEVCRSLAPGQVAVTFSRLDRVLWDAERDQPIRDGKQYLAQIVEADGLVATVVLGGEASIESLVRSWRDTVGAESGRGVGTAGPTGPGEIEAGCALRRAVLDPIFRAIGASRPASIVVCPDGVLHTVPFDALPLDPPPDRAMACRRVGDEVAVRRVLRLGSAPRAERAAAIDSRVAVVGGIDFDRVARSEEPAFGVPADSLALSRTPWDEARPGPWTELPGAAREVGTVASVARGAGCDDVLQLGGADVTEARLRSSLQGRDVVHIATHGWVVPGFGGSTVQSFAPLSLCGLVLSGASAAHDPETGAQRLLSATELASFDLSDCDLAVLSACSTNVGVLRAGQGIESLQAALHRAGVARSVTSLWNVSDDATASLMERFYANLWVDGMEADTALWTAKLHLRRAGAPASQWAAWVLVEGG